jgi:hypothetical protein
MPITKEMLTKYDSTLTANGICTAFYFHLEAPACSERQVVLTPTSATIDEIRERGSGKEGVSFVAACILSG